MKAQAITNIAIAICLMLLGIQLSLHHSRLVKLETILQEQIAILVEFDVRKENLGRRADLLLESRIDELCGTILIHEATLDLHNKTLQLLSDNLK